MWHRGCEGSLGTHWVLQTMKATENLGVHPEVHFHGKGPLGRVVLGAGWGWGAPGSRRSEGSAAGGSTRPPGCLLASPGYSCGPGLSVCVWGSAHPRASP